MHYFIYCTWLHDVELKRFMPEARVVTTAYAPNHRLEFHAAGSRTDRGWCHLSDTASAAGYKALGIVVEHDPVHFEEDYDDFDRIFLTVRGDDGVTYDCWTYTLTTPGVAMRPPNFYWQHIPDGMKQFNFPAEYIAQIQKTFDDAAPCPRADRPNPSAIPGKSAESR